MMRKLLTFLFFSAFLPSLLLTFPTSCSKVSGGLINPNFTDVSDLPIEPVAAIEANNSDQVVIVDPTADGQGGRLGSIAEQNTSTVLCVIIDPADGDAADLEVCQADRANGETTSINGICPDAVSTSRCASNNAGSDPDFCQVTGNRDYVFVIINQTPQSAAVAFQVVDVTNLPTQSCADLNITENSIQADNL